jgi:hypothetical protein
VARKTKNEDVMDSVSYAKDVLKNDGGMMGSSAGSDMLVKITGAKLGSRFGGGITGASGGAYSLSRKEKKK